MTGKRLFDDWPERYDAWFETPVGRLVLEYEQKLIGDLLRPARDELILDAGCGTGIFTRQFLASGACVIGLDMSLPMLARARTKLGSYPFSAVGGDMKNLPFADAAFDRVVSITALEFIRDAEAAVAELFRVAKRGGCIVVATLNSLSPWAARRTGDAKNDETSIFREVIFRPPSQIMALAPVEGVIRTAIHFRETNDAEKIREIEREGQVRNLDTGAFLAVQWRKPD